MTEELKARIAQINAGTAPAGYKKTKVGIVPEEWEVSEIGKQLVEYRELSNDIEQYPVYSSSRKGLMPQSDYYDKKDAVQTNLGYKMVSVGYATYRHMSDDDIFHFNINLTESTILVSCEYPVFTIKQTANQYFVITSLNETARFRYFCRTQKLGGTRTRLYFSNLAKYKLALPPLPEQQKIAEILIAQDEVIALLQKQIELKQQQKKALMQKLLSGEVRVGSGEWQKRKIKEFCRTSSGTTPSRKEQSNFQGDILWLSSGELKSKYVFDSAEKISEQAAVGMRVYEAGTVVIAIYGLEAAGIRGTCSIIQSKCTISQACMAFTDFDGIINEFFYYWYLWQGQIIGTKYAQGTKQQNLSSDIVDNILVNLPSLPEQEKIAEILSAQDKEIELLQQQLALEQQKKKALMQLLLTGKVRCV